MKTTARMTCHTSIETMARAVAHYRANAFEPFTLREWISHFGEVYTAHFVREFCLCKDGMVRMPPPLQRSSNRFKTYDLASRKLRWESETGQFYTRIH